MKLNSLNAISPIDGRYSEKCRKLSNYFSEESLIKYRVLVEIEYFLKLTESNIPNFKDFPKNQECKKQTFNKRNCWQFTSKCRYYSRSK